MDAAQWSAVAAGASAVAAFLMYLIMRRNSLESARPEIVLDGWERRFPGNEESEVDQIRVASLYNAGRGLARSVRVVARDDSPDKWPSYSTYGMSAARVPVLGPGESEEVGFAVILLWDSDPGDEDSQSLPVEITVRCWDLRNRRHDIRYRLVASQVDPDEYQGPWDELAPGLAYVDRTTTSHGKWYLTLEKHLQDLWSKVGW